MLDYESEALNKVPRCIAEFPIWTARASFPGADVARLCVRHNGLRHLPWWRQNSTTECRSMTMKIKNIQVVILCAFQLISACDASPANTPEALANALNGHTCIDAPPGSALTMRFGDWSFSLPHTFEFRGADGSMARFVQGAPSAPEDYSVIHVGPSEMFGVKPRQGSRKVIARNGLEISLFVEKGTVDRSTLFQVTTKVASQGISITSSDPLLIGRIIGCGRYKPPVSGNG